MRAPAVAILDVSSAAGPAGLRWHDPGAHESSHLLPGVRGFSYHQIAGEDGELVAVDRVERGLRRPVARSVRRVRSLARFLGTSQLRLGDGVYCEVITSPSMNVSAFAPFWSGSRSYHVLITGADSLPPSVAGFGAVNFVTGSCLFSDRALRVHGDSGTSFSCLRPGGAPIDGLVRRIESSEDLTLYELESACRLPWLTASLIALLPPGMPVSVTLDVPRIQYYLYLLDGFERGFVSADLMLHWFELVDERNAQVSALLEHELAEALSDEQPGRPVHVGRADGMAFLEPAIRRSVRTPAPLRLADIAGMLSANDAVWATAIGTADPATYRDLINLSYAVEQLRSGIAPRGERPQLGIAIDNPGERRSYTHARAVAAATSKKGDSWFEASLLGLYPLERAFTSKATGPSDLYYHDPGHTFTDPGGREYGTDELLAGLYPDLPRVPRPVYLRRDGVAAIAAQSPDPTAPPGRAGRQSGSSRYVPGDYREYGGLRRRESQPRQECLRRKALRARRPGRCPAVSGRALAVTHW